MLGLSQTFGKVYSNMNNWTYNVGYRGDQYPNIEIPTNFTVEDYEVF